MHHVPISRDVLDAHNNFSTYTTFFVFLFCISKIYISGNFHFTTLKFIEIFFVLIAYTIDFPIIFIPTIDLSINKCLFHWLEMKQLKISQK